MRWADVEEERFAVGDTKEQFAAEPYPNKSTFAAGQFPLAVPVPFMKASLPAAVAMFAAEVKSGVGKVAPTAPPEAIWIKQKELAGIVKVGLLKRLCHVPPIAEAYCRDVPDKFAVVVELLKSTT